MLICASHWKGLCGLGMKHDVDMVILTPRFLYFAFMRQQCKDLVRHLRDADYVFVRFCRQAEHIIQLHTVPAAGKGYRAGVQRDPPA